MGKSFVSLLDDFFDQNDKKLLDQPERFKSLFLDFSQNERRAEALIFTQLLASKEAAEIKAGEDIDTAALQSIANRFYQTYLFDKDVCRTSVFAYACFKGLIGKEDLPSSEPGGDAGIVPPREAPAPRPVKGPTLRHPVSENFVLIKGGTFMMGSRAIEPERKDNETQHQVTVSSFYMGKYEVTQKEYAAIMGQNPSRFKGDNNPVEQVDWYDAIEYCNRRSEWEGLTPAYNIDKTKKDTTNESIYTLDGYSTLNWMAIGSREAQEGTTVIWNRDAQGGAAGYRLPTEAEWEYACRAGVDMPFNTGYNITTDQANYNGRRPYGGNAKGIYRKKTTEVGTFAPNAWGLYDMHGNVWECCWDWYGDYESAGQVDPAGTSLGSYRVVRGGSWYNDAQFLRSANRSGITPSYRNNDVGFRLVRPLAGKAPNAE
jgi:formylglycine-generating enzyme required for sulfatase activity